MARCVLGTRVLLLRLLHSVVGGLGRKRRAAVRSVRPLYVFIRRSFKLDLRAEMEGRGTSVSSPGQIIERLGGWMGGGVPTTDPGMSVGGGRLGGF